MYCKNGFFVVIFGRLKGVFLVRSLGLPGNRKEKRQGVEPYVSKSQSAEKFEYGIEEVVMDWKQILVGLDLAGLKATFQIEEGTNVVTFGMGDNRYGIYCEDTEAVTKALDAGMTPPIDWAVKNAVVKELNYMSPAFDSLSEKCKEAIIGCFVTRAFLHHMGRQ